MSHSRSATELTNGHAEARAGLFTTLFPLKHLKRVYCAGPLFNEAERREMTRIADILRSAGFEPFVPHADGMEFAQLQPYLVRQGHDARNVGQWLHEAVFALDIYQVMLGCGSLVFNMNGRVPDEGAVAEATMAWMLGKPVVLYKEDCRSPIKDRDNPLLVGQCGWETISDMKLLPAVLKHKLAELKPDANAQLPCPPHMQRMLSAGARLWQELERLGPTRPNAEVSQIILELFGPAPPAINGHAALPPKISTLAASP